VLPPTELTLAVSFFSSFTGLNRASFHHNRCVVEHLLQGGKFALRDENIVTKLKSLLSSRSDTEAQDLLCFCFDFSDFQFLAG